MLMHCCFFFQAEDGIRDWSVTGVQTCALPILGPGWQAWPCEAERAPARRWPNTICARQHPDIIAGPTEDDHSVGNSVVRSEERRVGKEGRVRGVGTE